MLHNLWQLTAWDAVPAAFGQLAVQHIDFVPHSHSLLQDEQVVTKRQLSRNPSIQGVWSGSTFSAELKAENIRRQRMKPLLQR